MKFQVVEVDELQGRFMGGLQNDRRRATRVEGFLPTRGAETPLIPGAQPGKIELGTRGAEIVATAF